MSDKQYDLEIPFNFRDNDEDIFQVLKNGDLVLRGKVIGNCEEMANYFTLVGLGFNEIKK